MRDEVKNSSESMVVHLKINGMSCQNCVRHVREALQAVEGVESVEVRLDTNDAVVKRAMPVVGADAGLVQAVEAAGFGASILREPAVANPEGMRWDGPLVVGVFITVCFMVGEWVLRLGAETWYRWFSLVLGTVVQVYSGRGFYLAAWRQLKQGRSSMDTLVVLGSTMAYVLSLGLLISGSDRHLHFMEAASIISLISLGHWIESRVSRRAESALVALMHLAPEFARRQEANKSETEVPVADLRLNDAIVLRPGDSIPVDGTVIEGDSCVDESMLTGESMPIDKQLHDRLYAGTVNLNGRLLMLVTGTGEHTALARIIDAVKRAQGSRANIQRLADRISNVFVPVVVLVAIATGLWWGFAPDSALAVHSSLAGILWHSTVSSSPLIAALLNMAAVFIIACPCAMGLATPAAIMVSANTAARRGILIRDGVALEKAGMIDAVVFDKTGTLTRGKPDLVRFETYLGEGERPPLDEMRVAVSLAHLSNHPLSKAVASYGGSLYELRNWEEIRGKGLEAQLELDPFQARPYLVRLGSLNWMAELKIDVTRGAGFVDEWAGQGATILAISVDDMLMGFIAVRDELKSGAEQVVKEIKNHGWQVAMVTGDNFATAHAVARQAGIPRENVFAEASPERKPELIRELQKEGRKVAFVGDGINDAPALEQADLGIAVCHANDISRRAADMILLRSRISVIPEALGLARVTLKKIRQNLFWAFFYNVAAIPLAAMGFINPMLCAVAMGASDLIVLGNAMTLYWWKPFRREKILRAIKEHIDGSENLE